MPMQGTHICQVAVAVAVAGAVCVRAVVAIRSPRVNSTCNTQNAKRQSGIQFARLVLLHFEFCILHYVCHASSASPLRLGSVNTKPAASRKNAEVTLSASPIPMPGCVAITPIVYGAIAPAIRPML